jgi:hypothetical protein
MVTLKIPKKKFLSIYDIFYRKSNEEFLEELKYNMSEYGFFSFKEPVFKQFRRVSLTIKDDEMSSVKEMIYSNSVDGKDKFSNIVILSCKLGNMPCYVLNIDENKGNIEITPEKDFSYIDKKNRYTFF